MTEYIPFSSVGWLDLDDAASRRIGELIHALQEPGTLDPLGLGSIRDAFSDLLAPGVSTIQTRLRYFLFIPWICQQIEAEGLDSTRFLERLREDESILISCLRHLGANNGVQGYSAGEELKRMPSAAYWGGLRSWGIRRINWSLNEYSRQVPLLRHRRDRDDDEMGAHGLEMWSSLPPLPANFLVDDIGFDVSREEASFLVGQIRQTQPGSLLAAACAAPGCSAQASWPWEVDNSRLTEHLIEVLEHARNFSILTVGPQALYNLMIAERARDELQWQVDEAIERATEDLLGWVGTVESEHERYQNWVDDLSAFWAILVEEGTILRPKTKNFIEETLRAAVRDPRRFARDVTVREKIRRREEDIKGPSARLVSHAALAAWKGQQFGSQLSYRWPTCVSFLQDLADAQEAGV